MADMRSAGVGSIGDRAPKVAPAVVLDGAAMVLDYVRRGVPVLYGEFRLWKADEIGYTSKKSGQQVKAAIVRFTVEGQHESFPVTEWLPEGVKKESYVCPFQKGDRVLVVISGWFQEKGQTTVRGRLVSVGGSI